MTCIKKRHVDDWCVPEGTLVDVKEKTFILPDHPDNSLCIQAPYSLHQSMMMPSAQVFAFYYIKHSKNHIDHCEFETQTTENNHFEIVLADEFDDDTVLPALALCSASPIDPPPTSQFKQDYLRFWPVGKGTSSGDIAFVIGVNI